MDHAVMLTFEQLRRDGSERLGVELPAAIQLPQIVGQRHLLHLAHPCEPTEQLAQRVRFELPHRVALHVGVRQGVAGADRQLVLGQQRAVARMLAPSRQNGSDQDASLS